MFCDKKKITDKNDIHIHPIHLFKFQNLSEKIQSARYTLFTHADDDQTGTYTAHTS
jgi:hypothetical protein